MSGLIALPWIIFVAVILAVFILAVIIVKWYEDRYESEKLTTVVAAVALTVGLLTLLLIPVDVYSVSSTVDPSTGLRYGHITQGMIDARSKAVQVMYYALYCSVFVFSFIIIPFAYFFYEEAGLDVPLKSRIWAGCKYTIFLLVIVIILLVVGLFVKGSSELKGTDNAKTFVKDLFDSENRGEASITFTASCLAVIGYLCWLTYTAYGLSAFPMGFLKGRRDIVEDEVAISEAAAVNRERQRTLRAKYLAGDKLSRKDQTQKTLLEREERVLSRNASRLERAKGCCLRCASCLKPFSIVFGIVFLLISLLIVVSLVITQVDKVSNGFAHFVVAHPQIRNPIDKMLEVFARAFPVDYVVFAALVAFIFLCSAAGIVGIGVRMLWIKLYDIERGASAPQGILLMAIILMLTTLALNFNLMTLAPQYTTFGTQTYYNHTTDRVLACTIDAPPGNCTMTQLATMVNRVNLRLNVFGQAFYWATWAFLGVWVLGLIVAICKRRRSHLTGYDALRDEDDELYGKRSKYKPREWKNRS